MHPTLRRMLMLLPTAALAADPRLAPPRDLDSGYPFSPPTDAAAWTPRAERLRTETRVALGLLPEPDRTPLRAVVHGRVERDDYTVERVYFESMPGLFVTGSLYRPRPGVGREGTAKRPAVLCPHGHWSNGRFHEKSREELQKDLASGAERFAEGGRSPLQARCVRLARMGCVVFHYDMLGYADSVQIPMAIAHGFKTQRPDMNAADGWGFFSPRAEGWLQSVAGLQAWNSIRAIDFMSALPDVDPARIGVTGASGGATQTFLVGAVDARATALFPAVMVSTGMQGGCTCENASLLRLREGNVGLAALCAPRPLGLTAADDWTRTMPTEGFPQLARLYEVLGNPGGVSMHARLEFGHNYNAPSRDAMAAFFNRAFGLGLPPEALADRDYVPLTREELTVWDGNHPAPTGEQTGPAFERGLLAGWARAITARRDPAADEAGWRVLLGRTLAEVDAAPEFAAPPAKANRGDWLELRGTVVARGSGESVEAVFLHPARWNGRVVIWLAGREDPDEAVARLVRGGTSVVLSRLFAPGAGANPVVQNPREAPAYTYAYNSTLFTRRVHDVLTLVRFCSSREAYPARSVDVAGWGPWSAHAAAARLVAGQALRKAAGQKDGFRWADLTDWKDEHLLPGALRYGDLPGLWRQPGCGQQLFETQEAMAEWLSE